MDALTTLATQRFLAVLAALAVLGSAACGTDRLDSMSSAIRVAEISRDAASPILSAGTADNDPRIRELTAVALGRIQDPDSATTLAGLAEDLDPAVATAALFALGQLGLASGAHAAPTAVEACTRHARSGSPRRVALAVECLGKQAPGDANVRIEKAFSHPDKGVRVEAAHAAMRLRFAPVWRGEVDEPPAWPEAFVSRMSNLLEDAEVDVRRAAAHAFSRYGDPRGTAALGAALGDDDPLVRLFAARALGRGGDPTASASLERACSDLDAGVRTEAIAALAALEAPGRIPAGLADDPSIHVRAAFAAAAASRPDGPDVLVGMLADPSATVVSAAVIALAETDPVAAEARSAALAVDPRWPVRAACATAAGRFGVRGLAILERLARDDEATVRSAAIAATEDASDDPAARAIVERGLAATTLAERGSAVVRVAGSRWGDRVTVLEAAFEAAAGVDGIELRETIVDAVAADPAAAALLERAAKDPAPSVRARARAALGIDREPGDEDGGLAREPPFGAWGSGEAPVVVLDTDRGVIEIRTLPDVAPYHVANLVALVRSKAYDGLPWHRVVSNFVIQGGDPEGTGWGGPGWTVPDEISTIRFERGVLGMPKAGKDTGGCQLFLTLIPTPHLDGNYTVFGEVVSGLEVLDRIEVGDRIRSARVAGDRVD